MNGLEETRRAVEAGGPSCLVIDDLIWRDLDKLAWSGTAAHVRAVAHVLAQVERGEAEYLVVRALDGTPVAKAAIDYVEAPGVGTIMQMATHTELQSLGLGSALIAVAEERIRGRGVTVARLGVEDDNPRARVLYERLGYRAVQRRVVSWEAESPDGSLFEYRTEITELDKALT
ncbi:MAG TPA: GNAT family N-acetyltransferase [Acidimicrobiales bacterium]|nr:GNAT family N-acetyltransferase [Acidimicrobiales bacterium]